MAHLNYKTCLALIGCLRAVHSLFVLILNNWSPVYQNHIIIPVLKYSIAFMECNFSFHIHVRKVPALHYRKRMYCIMGGS